MPEDAPTKVCPLCAETIKAAARLCPHCRKAQNRWLLFISRFDLLALVTFVAFLGVGWLVVHLLSPVRDFSSYQNQIKFSKPSFSIDKNQWATNRVDTNLVVDGVLSNESDYSWQIEEFEIRFFGDDGKVLKVVNGNDSFIVMPHAEHSFHFKDYRENSIPASTNFMMFVNSAEDPRKYDLF